MTSFQTLAYAVEIQLINDEILGLTNIDFGFNVNGVLYEPLNAVDPVASKKALGLEIDNTTVSVLLNETNIRERDIRAGLYNRAPIHIALVDVFDLPSTLFGGTMILRGFIGQIDVTNGRLTFEVVSFTESLNRSLSNLASPICPYVFGGQQCAVDLDAGGLIKRNVDIVTAAGTLIEVDGSVGFLDPALYDGKGILTVDTGRNKNLQFRILQVSGTTLNLEGTLADDLIPGTDTVTFRAGCNKTREDCTTYNNIRRFGGFFVGGRWMRGYAGLLFQDQ
jgi:uncharacterized phage protein (TIGR02218 family)